MNATRSWQGFLLLVSLAGLGLLLMWLPTQILQLYQAAKELGPTFVTIYFTIVGVGGVLFFGTSGYMLYRMWSHGRRKQQRREEGERNPSELSPQELKTQIADNLTQVNQLQNDPQLSPELAEQLRPLVARLEEKQAAAQLEIVAFGTISSGKSSLLNALAGRELFTTELKGGTTTTRQEMPWLGTDRVTLVDTPGLAEVAGEAHIAVATVAARDADLILLVLDGPLRDSEVSLLNTLGQMEKPMLICLNKADWYSDREREELLGQIRTQTAKWAPPQNVLAVRSQATKRPRLIVSPQGEDREELVPVPADISPLAERMLALIQQQGQVMLLANLLMQSRGLVVDARERAKRLLDQRAREIVERYTWGAGGAAALSPLPVLDLVAGSAITAKMVVDLAAVYKQEVDLDLAVKLLSELGKNLLAILGVTAAGPAVAGAVASLLKTVPGVGTLVGGVLQGLVQALVTRWIGAVFIDYFQQEMRPTPTGLANLARNRWQQVTTLTELQRLVRDARREFFGKD
jgi:uncharacterized protein